MTQPVLCVGYPSLDHVAHVHRPDVAGGTRVIERHWRRGTAGGCAANVAVALAHLGVPSAVGFAVGDDPESQAYLGALEGARVDVALVDRLVGERMPRSYFFVDDAGECELFFDPAASRAWQGPRRLDLGGVRWLVIAVGPPIAARRFTEEARRRGVPVVWQLKRDRQAFPEDALAEYLSAADVVFANEGELADLCERVGVRDADDLLRLGPRVVVATLGARGARVTDEEGTAAVPALPVTAVDATGAGDAFTAGFLFGRYHGRPKVECARFGSVLASFVVEGRGGCQGNLPTLTDAAQRYERAFGESLLPAPAGSPP